MSAYHAAVLLAAVAAAVAPVPGRAAADPACSGSGYSYGGFQGSRSYGIAATIGSRFTPRIDDGHAAAWVGVGAGDEWLQVGLSALQGGRGGLYYEVAERGSASRYVDLGSVLPGERHRVAVLETARSRGSWRVWVDGRPVTAEIRLRGSHGAWAPVATAESWRSGGAGCNAFAYSFDAIAAATRPGGVWRPLRDGTPLHDAGFRMRGSARAFRVEFG